MTIPELYAAIDGDYESAKRILPMDKLIEKFIVRLLDDKSYDRLLAAMEAKNTQEIFEATHAIKGMCANLGLNTLSGMASVVSEEFRPGNKRTMSDEEVSEKMHALCEKYASTMDQIKAFANK